jgi:hypothetical protein
VKLLEIKEGLANTVLQSMMTRVMKEERYKQPFVHHDHIIRNEESYSRILNYIQNNPLNWKEDKFYT